eukprot:4374941-Pyramimonas_sp.AAC.1
MNSSLVLQTTQPYFLVAWFRIIIRSACTLARFLSCPSGCASGGPPQGANDLDDVGRYARCSRLYSLLSKWLGCLLPPSSSCPEGVPWLSSVLLFTSASPVANVLYASCIDAFLALHSARRRGVQGAPDQSFETSLRMHARRRKFVAQACRVR